MHTASSGDGSSITLIAFVILATLAWMLFGQWVKRRAYLLSVADFRWDPAMSPTDFERHCADYLAQRGWNAKTTKGSGDQGVDVLAEKAGVRVVLQCKKYSRPVGNKAVQEAHAGMAFARAHRAAVVSNQGYTPGAQQIALSTGVLLLHFTDLARADELFGIRVAGATRAPRRGADASFLEEDEGNRVGIQCPGCRSTLRLPRGGTGMVRCPRCGRRFEAHT